LKRSELRQIIREEVKSISEDSFFPPSAPNNNPAFEKKLKMFIKSLMKELKLSYKEAVDLIGSYIA
jgi:hypothetical protein